MQGFAIVVTFFCALPLAFGADIELAKDSTLEGILRRGKLRVGLEPGYMPFEMIDPDFLKWLNKFLKELKEDGRYDRIYKKWFTDSEWFRHVR